MKKKIISGALVVLVSFMLIGCGANANTGIQNKTEDKLKIAVSIYPLKEFAEKIAGDKADVICLVPDNMEPHDYEPKTKDFQELTKSNAFIYNGLGMEEWVGQVNEAIKKY